MRKVTVLALFLSCSAAGFNPPYVNSDQVVPGATVGNCVKANPGGYLTSSSCASGASVPTPNATGQTLYSANGTTFSLLGIGTTGDVLTVAGGVPTWAAGGGGGPTLGGDNAWTGTSTFASAGTTPPYNPPIVVTADGGTEGVLKYSASGGPVTIGPNVGGAACFAGPVTGGLLSVAQAGVPALALDIFGNFQVCGAVYSGPSGAPILLGNTGAPSGACTNGSMYTRADGSVGAALYVCYGATWHASAV